MRNIGNSIYALCAETLTYRVGSNHWLVPLLLYCFPGYPRISPFDFPFY